MGLLPKYADLHGMGMKVETVGNKITLIFSDLEKFHRFLLLYEKDDFAGLHLEVNSLANCQGCGQPFMGGLAGEMVELAAAQAKETAVLGGQLILHLCPFCQIEEAGRLQQMIDDVEAKKKRLHIVN